MISHASDVTESFDTVQGLPPVAPLDMPTQVLERRPGAPLFDLSALQSLMMRVFARHA